MLLSAAWGAGEACTARPSLARVGVELLRWEGVPACELCSSMELCCVCDNGNTTPLVPPLLEVPGEAGTLALGAFWVLAAGVGRWYSVKYSSSSDSTDAWWAGEGLVGAETVTASGSVCPEVAVRSWE